MKLQGWEQRLAEYLRDCHSGKVNLSRYDCAKFAALWVSIATGRTVEHPFLKDNVTCSDSLNMLSQRTLESCVSEVLTTTVSISQVMRGDIVLRRQDGLSALGICDGENSYFLHEKRGLNPLPTSQCDIAWSVE